MLLDNLVVLAARAILGIFLASLIGVLAYLLAVPVVLSIWELSFVNYNLMGVLTIGVGAGAGSFLAWFNRDMRLPVLVGVLALAIAGAVGGAWGGLQRGDDVYKLQGTLGVPALSLMTIGAIIGGNIPMLAIGVLRAIRNPRV